MLYDGTAIPQPELLHRITPMTNSQKAVFCQYYHDGLSHGFLHQKSHCFLAGMQHERAD